MIKKFCWWHFSYVKKEEKSDLMFASEIFQLGSKCSELFLHKISSDLSDIFTQQSILILKKKRLGSSRSNQFFLRRKSNNFELEFSKEKKIQKVEGDEQTLAAAAVCNPPIPGLLLIIPPAATLFKLPKDLRVSERERGLVLVGNHLR